MPWPARKQVADHITNPMTRWDFVGRTLGMLFNVDPARPIGTVWEDCTMRAMMAQMLIKDKTGKLDAMNRSSGYNTDAGIEFGTELLNVAEALTV